MSDTLQITSDGVIEEEGYYLNTDGHVSSTGKLQDNHYYQDFSYEIETGVSTNFYRDSTTEYLHPVGTKMFGRYMWETDVPVMPTLPPHNIRYDYHQDGPFIISAAAVETLTVAEGIRNVIGVPVSEIGGVSGPVLCENSDTLTCENDDELHYEGRAVGGSANVQPKLWMWSDLADENGREILAENGLDTFGIKTASISIGRNVNFVEISSTCTIDTTNIQFNLDKTRLNMQPLNVRPIAEEYEEGLHTSGGVALVVTEGIGSQYHRILG